MTDHPLTDEIIEDLAQFEPDLTDSLRLNRTHDMRAAYDKGSARMLEKVIEFLGFELYRYTEASFVGVTVIDYDNLIKDLKKAMRPQENQ